MLSGDGSAPQVHDYCALRRRSARERAGRFVIEGAAHLHAALETRTPIDGLLVCDVPLARMGLPHLDAWKRRVGAVVVGSSAKAQRPYDRMPRGRPLVLMLGCERRGMTRAQRRVCDLSVTIPMVPGVSSLNVAVAAGVMLFAARGVAT